MSVGCYSGFDMSIHYSPSPGYPYGYFGSWDVPPPPKPPAPVHQVEKLHKLCDADGVVFTSSDKASLSRYIDERNKLLLAAKDQLAKIRKRHEAEIAKAKLDGLEALAKLDERASQGRI